MIFCVDVPLNTYSFIHSFIRFQGAFALFVIIYD